MDLLVVVDVGEGVCQPNPLSPAREVWSEAITACHSPAGSASAARWWSNATVTPALRPYSN